MSQLGLNTYWPILSIDKDDSRIDIRKRRRTKMARKDSLQDMREILLERRTALRQAVSGDDSLLREISQRQGGDEADFALESSHGEINSQLAEASSRELAYVENALSRFEDNTYGKCEACKKGIPLARLQALPYATFCIECKQKVEQSGIEPGANVDWSAILDGADTFTDMNFNIS